MFEHNWTITGDNPFADGLRVAASFVPSDRPITITTESDDVPGDVWVAGPAVLTAGSGRYAPYYAAFEAIEEVRRGIEAGDVGKVYGLFGSFRVARSTQPTDVAFDALLPIVAVALDNIRSPVTRVWATNASLIEDGDAWFVHLRTASEILITLEAMACTDSGLGPELLVEVTGHDRVLRAEPMRQSIVVEPLGAAPQAHGWWEDLNERYLALVRARNDRPDDDAGPRIRQVWDAIQQSSAGGLPVTLG